jgi:hypothetical protein
MDREKRQLRKLKRDIKQAGNKKRRQKLKRDLRDNPHEAHWSEPTVGKLASETLNGLDQDATRKRKSCEP